MTDAFFAVAAVAFGAFAAVISGYALVQAQQLRFERDENTRLREMMKPYST